MIEISDLAAGKVGEYLVCADLILRGYTAFPSEQGLPYDVVADINGRLLKVQVKTTRGLRQVPQRKDDASGYLFHVGKCGKGGVKQYSDFDVNLFALVALDDRVIGYMNPSGVKRTMIFRAPQNRGKHHDEVMEARRVAVHKDKASGMSNAEIARKHGMDHTVVWRALRRFKNTFKASPYLDNLTLDAALSAANDNFSNKVAA